MHFRRLAIVDLDARSNQPFGQPDRGLLVYNGEIYNAAELRKQLLQSGVVFRTRGDTEVLYELLLQPDWHEMLDKADGMFAFVLILPSGEVRFGRDRFGVKPLYMACDTRGSLVALASELSPLRQAGLAGPGDPVAAAQGLFFLWTPPPRTGWQRCVTAPIGTVLSSHSPHYRDTPVVWTAPALCAEIDIAETVRTSLTRQLNSDVPVGLLLSGGLDSSWLAMHLAEMKFNGPILVARSSPDVDRTAEPFDEDAPFAARLADSLGMDITWLELDLNVIRGIPEMVNVVEQPFGDPASLVLLELCRRASTEATVVLSGIGVEELFLGYERYQAVRALQAIPSPLRTGMAAGQHLPLSRRYRERRDKFVRLLHLDPLDWAWASQSYYTAGEWARLVPDIPLDQVVEEHRLAASGVLADGGTPLAALSECDRQLFLPGLNLTYSDRASMRASIELRVPFLGEPVAATALTVDAEKQLQIRNGKARFRAAAKAAGVPQFVTKRAKTGFGAPVRTLLRAHGSELWERVEHASIFRDLVDPRVARQFLDEHVSGERERGLALYGLLCLTSWWQSNVGNDNTVADALLEFAPTKDTFAA